MHSSAAEVCRSSTNARSASTSSTTPSIPTAGVPRVKPIARAPSLHVGLADQLLGHRVGHVVDAGALDAGVDPALVGGVRRPAVGARVPVEVVLGDVEHGGRLCAHRGGVVQLEAGQLDGEHVVRLGVHHRLDDRQADVAAGDRAQPGGAQHRLEHLHGGGLAVGAGDGQPGRRRARGRAAARPARPRPRPGRRARPPARAAATTAPSPGEVTTRSTSSGSVAVEPAPSRTVAPRISSSVARSRRSPASDSSSAVTWAPEEGQVVRGGVPGDAEAGDDDADAAPVAGAAERSRRRLMTPATHSA